MQSVNFEQTSTNFTKIFVPLEQFLYRKKNIVETISVTINDRSDVICFDIHLINIFAKSMNAD